ncbi:MAG: SDR family oxidoreductase [Candidatus Tectomicrobia bacterium]|uniref:SDR family oxidoreductase n=1 Tax=Tectimicrobiota bacterium TaxID=2528274 RepID=A0A932MQE5_UNCTE|nr:SDR family oxidoreductase [Candidatus Tectomicrobia bacterium]
MPPRDMEGKVAVVAAASRGLGRASARAIALRGARVAICGRREEEAAEAARAISEEAGVEAWSCAADMAGAEGVQRFVQGAGRRFGGIDVLVCNAGGPPGGGFALFSDEDWRHAVDLTLMSAVRLVREALPFMKGRGGGRIVFLGSSSVREPLDDMVLSNVLRPAVAGLSKSLSRELAPENILVNVVAPGTIRTDRVMETRTARAKREGVTVESLLQQTAAGIPLKRLGEPEEFGRVVAFLASPEGSYISGTTVVVDGGRIRGL